MVREISTIISAIICEMKQVQRKSRRFCERLSETLSERLSETLSERLSDTLSERLSETLSERLSERKSFSCTRTISILAVLVKLGSSTRYVLDIKF